MFNLYNLCLLLIQAAFGSQMKRQTSIISISDQKKFTKVVTWANKVFLGKKIEKYELNKIKYPT